MVNITLSTKLVFHLEKPLGIRSSSRVSRGFSLSSLLSSKQLQMHPAPLIIKIAGAKGIIDGAEPPLLMLVNGGNQLTITALTYDTQKEFEHMKELSLTLPRNAQGEPSEDYQLSNVNINGLPMTKITNPLHIGAPDEPGEDVKQIALHYFQESKKRSFAIVMLVYDEEAETDLNAITSSIQITQ